MHVLAAGGGGGGTVLGFVLIVVGIAVYWIPTVVAGTRHVPNLGSVVIINFFLGWTLIGWVVALAMACRSRAPSPQPAAPQPPPVRP